MFAVGVLLAVLALCGSAQAQVPTGSVSPWIVNTYLWMMTAALVGCSGGSCILVRRCFYSSDWHLFVSPIYCIDLVPDDHA